LLIDMAVKAEDYLYCKKPHNCHKGERIQ
jgi:hypothetical protein